MRLLNYYLAIIVPLFISFILLQFHFNGMFSVSLIFYYVYRCFLDFFKLKKQKVIQNKDYWKFIVPIWTFIYFEELYFK